MGWSVHHPVGLIHCAPSRCYRGYTLICTGGGQHAAILILACPWIRDC